MAQLSSAQREPSMEEILASIRRIIEDSDMIHAEQAAEVRADNDAAPVSTAAVASAHQSETPPGADVIEVEAFRAELRSLPPRREPEALARSAISLADVQAQVAADQIAARAAAERAYRDVATSSAPAVEAPQARPEPVVASAPRALEPVEWNLDNVLLAQELSSLTASEDDSSHQARMEPAFEPEAASAAPQEPAPVAEVVTAVQPLISDQTGKQVKAAFGELSEAFAARSKRTLDELAAEMLRPMLQEWLDNNLPLLVEKLVREEIERVARGS